MQTCGHSPCRSSLRNLPLAHLITFLGACRLLLAACGSLPCPPPQPPVVTSCCTHWHGARSDSRSLSACSNWTQSVTTERGTSVALSYSTRVPCRTKQTPHRRSHVLRGLSSAEICSGVMRHTTPPPPSWAPHRCHTVRESVWRTLAMPREPKQATRSTLPARTSARTVPKRCAPCEPTTPACSGLAAHTPLTVKHHGDRDTHLPYSWDLTEARRPLSLTVNRAPQWTLERVITSLVALSCLEPVPNVRRLRALTEMTAGHRGLGP